MTLASTLARPFPRPGSDDRRGEGVRRRRRLLARGWSVPRVALLLAVLAAVATFTNSPGWYIADARFEHYWAPSQFLSRHAHVWDAVRDLGGASPYFSPVVGAFLAGVRGIGASPAVAERALHSAYLLVAGVGMVQVLRLFRSRVGIEHLLAGALFAFNPYSAQFLLPSGLFLHYALAPWLVVAMVRGLREPGAWRWPAAFALTVFVVGALNWASLLYAATPLVPVAVYAVWVERTATWRQALAFAAAAGVLALAVGAAALTHGALNADTVAQNLSTTESPATVSRTSSWSESWRGLGFWLTYFGSPAGLLRSEAAAFFSRWDVVLATFLLPLGALVTLWRTRWRPRLLFGGMIVLALVLMVGIHPVDDPSPLGRALDAGYDRFVFLRSLRSGYKAGTGWAIGVSALVAVGVVEFVRRTRTPGDRRRGRAVAVGLATATVAGAASFQFWTGDLYSRTDRVKSVPAYWTDALSWLDEQEAVGRAFVLPGANRARYRWGYVGDDIFDALLDRPHVVQSSISTADAVAADLVASLERHASGTAYEPGVVGPIARRLGIRWIVLRNDLDWQRLDVARPADFADLRNDPDLSLIEAFGQPGQNVVAAGGNAALTGESRLPPVEIYAVRGARAPTRVVERMPPSLLAGGGDGWAPLATAGRLEAGAPVRYTGRLDAEEIGVHLAQGAPLVVTDTNRRRVTHVTSTRTYRSHTLAAGERTDRAPVALFERPGTESVATYGDARRITASSYGEGFEVLPTWRRPAAAFDDDPATAWEVSGLTDAVGEWLRVDFRRPVEVSEVTLEPSPGRRPGRFVSQARLRFSDGSSVPVALGATTRTVRFDPRATTELEIEIEAVSGRGSNGVGFAEVTLPGLDLRERIRVVDDVHRLAERDRPLRVALERGAVSYDFHRVRGDGPQDEERGLRRSFETSGTRRWSVAGALRLTATTPDRTVDAVLGGRVGAYGSSRHLGDLGNRGGLAVDGDVGTGWQAPATAGETLTVRFPDRPVGSIDLYTVVDLRSERRWSRVTDVRIWGDGGTAQQRAVLDSRAPCRPVAGLPDACVQRHRIATSIPSTSTLTVELVGLDRAPGPFGSRPVMVTEVAVGGLRPPQFLGGRARPPAGCTDLFQVDGRDVPVRMQGGSARLLRDLLDGRSVAFRGCDTVRLGAGNHRLDSLVDADGALDRVRLSAGEAARPDPRRLVGSSQVVEQSPTRLRVQVNAPQAGFLVAGPSYDEGWRARIASGPLDGRDLGPPDALDTLSGWELPAGTYEVVVSYAPQRRYEAALAVTAAAVAACLILVVRRRRS